MIDLSADFRFKAVYGLPELFKEQIQNTTLVANPGCYVTACILAAYPIQDFAEYIIFDCKSGWSGAGRESEYAKDPTLLKENLIPYKITKHRHKYEIEQFIKTKLSFTPHVFDAFQGMLCTVHIILKKDAQKNLTTEKIQEMYKEFYKHAPFVKITEKIPTVRDTQKTNLCLIGGFEMDENGQLVIISSIDNLLKGAAGQAVQNMNIMFNFEESEGSM